MLPGKESLSLLEGFCNENNLILEKGERLILERLFVFLPTFHNFLKSEDISALLITNRSR